MDPKHFEIKEYMIIWRQLEIQNFNGITAKVRAIVRCTGGDDAMDVFFLAEDSAFPDPFVDPKEKKGYIIAATPRSGSYLIWRWRTPPCPLLPTADRCPRSRPAGCCSRSAMR